MRTLTLLVALLGGLLSGCSLTPDEIERIRVENQLLREELGIVRENCSYYRGLKLEIDSDPAPEP